MGLGAGGGGEGLVIVEEAAQAQGILQGAGQQLPQSGIRRGELICVQRVQRGQHVLCGCPAARYALGAVAGEGGHIVMDAEVRRIRQRIVEVQGIGLQLLREELGGKAFEALFVPLICKQEKGQPQKSQKKGEAEKQLLGGKAGILFQKIT